MPDDEDTPAESYLRDFLDYVDTMLKTSYKWCPDCDLKISENKPHFCPAQDTWFEEDIDEMKKAFNQGDDPGDVVYLRQKELKR